MIRYMLFCIIMAVCFFTFMGGICKATSITGIFGSLYYGNSDTNFASAYPKISVTPGNFDTKNLNTAAFSVSQLWFGSNASESYSLWLSGSANYPKDNLNDLQWLYMSQDFNPNIFYSSKAKGTGTFFQFSGLLDLTGGTDLLITHDDGFSLSLTQVGATSPTFSLDSYAAPTTKVAQNSVDLSGIQPGAYLFTLNYGAYNGFPEFLRVQVVPEPSTFLLLGFGMIGLVLVTRKFSQRI